MNPNTELEQIEKIKLPDRWHYNAITLRYENIVDVHDENDNLVGTSRAALVPFDIQRFIFDNYVHKSEVETEKKKAVEVFVSKIVEDNSEIKQYWICPKCQFEKERFSKHDSVYCKFDGRKLKITEKKLLKNAYVDLYELEDIAKEYLSTQKNVKENL